MKETELHDALRCFIEEELSYLTGMLTSLEGKFEEEDFKSLENELNEKREELKSIKENDTRLLILKREVGFLEENLESAAKEGKFEEEDFKSLENKLNEKREELKSIKEDDTRLLILKRQVGFLKKNLESAATKKSWYSKIPITVWLQFILLPAVVYMLAVSLFQKQTQDIIQAYATQTAIATQSANPTASQTLTITSTPIK